MHDLVTRLRRALQRWRLEHASVADTAVKVNLARLRWVAPLVAALAGLHVVTLALQILLTPTGPLHQVWKTELLLAHLTMGTLMTGLTLVLKHWKPAGRDPWAAWLAPGVGVLTLTYVVLLVSIDQQVTSNVTPYLLGCMSVAMVLLLSPGMAAGVFAAGAVLFHWLLAHTQPDAATLLSNQLNGLSVGVLGWVGAVVMWRNFTLIERQQLQLAEANNALMERQRELERLTRRDGLTGLFNRNTFVELTEQELARAKRQANPTALLLLDLDFFKRVNDTHGHPAGDEVLRHVAKVLGSTVRSTDLVGRLGGEEFMVLLPGTTPQAAHNLAEKLRAKVQATPPKWQGQALPVTVSIGVSGPPPGSNMQFDQLYALADQALYTAKEQGRNRVV